MKTCVNSCKDLVPSHYIDDTTDSAKPACKLLSECKDTSANKLFLD